MSSCSSGSSIELRGLNRILEAVAIWTSPALQSLILMSDNPNKMRRRMFIDNDGGVEVQDTKSNGKSKPRTNRSLRKGSPEKFSKSISDFYPSQSFQPENHNGEKEKGIFCWSVQRRCSRRLEQAHKDAHQDVRRCGGL